MAVSVVQEASASTTAASVVVTLPNTVVAGDTLIASVCMVGGASVSSVTDSLGDRWIQTARSFQSDAGTEIWTARGCAAGAASVTANFTTAVSAGVNVLEASGLWYASPLDQWTQSNSTSASAGLPPSTVNTTPNLAVPSAPTVTVEGTTGSTAYAYEVAVANSVGQTTPSTSASVSTGNATLSTTDYNLIAWSAVPLPAGSSGNLVYDSNLTNAIATVGPTWGTSNVSVGTSAGDVNVLDPGTDAATIVFYGTGSAFSFPAFGGMHLSPPMVFPVLPSTTYIISALHDNSAASVAAGSYSSVRVFDQSGNFIGQTYVGPGVDKVVSFSFTTAASVTGVQIDVTPSNLEVPTGSYVSFSQIQLTQTTALEPYTPGPLWTYPVYRALPVTGEPTVYGLIGTTTALAFEDTGQTLVAPQTVTPRNSGDLVVAACSCNASVVGPGASYTALTMDGGANFGAGYVVLDANVSPVTSWSTVSGDSWAAVEAAFLPGASGLNPNLQFPEVSVQISTQSNWQAPFQGMGIWTELAPYVESFSAGPIGRQHELDRVQAAPSSITLDNRTGVFNPWNTTSFLYANGTGMKPMNPIKITGAWKGVTYPVYYGYFQSITNAIKDVLNVDATLSCIDILQILSLKYLASDNYAQLVKADGGSNLQAYYRLGDSPGSYSVLDSSGNGYNGSLINGLSGEPLWGQTGAFLYDPTTALDLTNGTNTANGGITTTDNSTQPPTDNNPLGSASVWTFECWEKWTGPKSSSLGTPTTFTGGPVFDTYMLSFLSGTLPGVGDLLTGPGVPSDTFITAVTAYSGGTNVTFTNALTVVPPSSGSTFSCYYGGTGSTLFSGTTPLGGVLDVRFGTYNRNDLIVYDTIMVGAPPFVIADPLVVAAYGQSVIAFDGNWHHIVVTYTGSAESFSIYVDGNVIGTGSRGVTFDDPAGITIGCDANAVNGFVGQLQDVALYGGIALTTTQIQHHYEVGKWFQAIELGAANGDASAARLNKVLAVSGLDPSTMLDIPSGQKFKTYLYAETNPVTTTSGLNYMQTTSETEPALIFQGPDGIIEAYGRQYQYLIDTATTSQGIFGDNTSTAAYHYEGTTLTMGQDDLDVFNDIQVQSGRGGYAAGAGYVPPGGIQGPGATVNSGGGQLEEWGPAQSTAMASSASAYGDRTLQGLTSLQFEYDSDSLSTAQNYGTWYSAPIMRIESMTLNSYSDNGVNIPQMLGRGLYDRVTVQYQGQVAGPQFSQDSVLESISHSVTISGGPVWATTVELSPYEILMKATYLGSFVFGGTAADGVLTL